MATIRQATGPNEGCGPYVPTLSPEERARRHREAIELLDSWVTEGNEEEQRETMALLREALGENRSLSSRTASTDAAILSRLIRPEHDDLSHEAAQALLRLHFDGADLDRLHELATKNQDDALTPAERSELESDLRISSFLDLMQAKARRSLKKHT